MVDCRVLLPDGLLYKHIIATLQGRAEQSCLTWSGRGIFTNYITGSVEKAEHNHILNYTMIRLRNVNLQEGIYITHILHIHTESGQKCYSIITLQYRLVRDIKILK